MSGVTEDYKNLSDIIRGSSSDYLTQSIGIPKAMIELKTAGIGLNRLESQQAFRDTPVTTNTFAELLKPSLSGLPDDSQVEALAGIGKGLEAVGWKLQSDGSYTNRSGKAMTMQDFGNISGILTASALSAINPIALVNGKKKQIAEQRDAVVNDKTIDDTTRIATIGTINTKEALLDQHIVDYKKNPEKYLLSKEALLRGLHGQIQAAGGDVSLVTAELQDTHKSLSEYIAKRAEQENWPTVPNKVGKLVGVPEGTRLPHDAYSHIMGAWISLQGVYAKVNQEQKAAMNSAVITGITTIVKDAGDSFDKTHVDAAGQRWLPDSKAENGKNMKPSENEWNIARQVSIESQIAPQIERLKSTYLGAKTIGGPNATPTPGPGGAPSATDLTNASNLFSNIRTLGAQVESNLAPHELKYVKTNMSNVLATIKTNPAQATQIMKNIMAVLQGAATRKARGTQGPGLRERDVMTEAMY